MDEGQTEEILWGLFNLFQEEAFILIQYLYE